MATKKSENPKERLTARIFNSKWRKLVTVMASVVVFTTVYALILPAITMSAQDAKCGYEEHMHTEECYDAEGNFICEFEEHIHSLACYSDLYADLENPETWEASIPALSGDRNADVVAIAESQLGYRESDKNYLVSDEDQTQGYTRYGHWFGDVVDGSGERLENGLSTFAYADWNAIFASFVLDHAGIYDFGLDSDAGNWAGALAAAGIYEDAADYIPEAGDLVFYTPYSGAGIQVGIVTGVNKGFLGFGDISSISVISGDSDNAVDEVRVAVADYNEGDVVFESIHGYGVLTPREEGTEDVSEAQEVIDESGAETEIPADETTADEAALISEEVPEEEAVADESVTETASGNAVEVVSGDVSVVEQLIPEGTSVAETAEGGVAEDPAEIKEELTKEEVTAEQPTEGEADEAADGTEETIANLSDDTEHVIGSSSEDLEKVEEIAAGNVQVNALETSGLSEEGSSVIMNWHIAAQLEEDVLPAGAIIRVDTATGKMHAMSVEEAKAWAGTVSVGGEEVALCEDENYEVIFVGNNNLLYTWADVQAMNEDAVTAFVGVQVKVMTDVEIADGTIAFDFATSAKVADANVGQNYYVTKVNINGWTGSGNYVYENGVAVQPDDQERVLQDAGLDYVAPSTLVAEGNDYTVTMTYGEDAQIPDVAKLYVKEIVSGTEEYDNYIAEAKKALGISEAAEVVLQGRFFDIKIMTKDGEFEPKAPVQVNIEYHTAIADIPEENVSAVHFAKDGAECVDVETNTKAGEVNGVGFEADSFSVYGVVYTVDFVYNGYEYSLDGDHVILLSELLPILGIDEEETDVQDVIVELSRQNDETADAHEFYVEKIDGEWILKSDVGFRNEYLMTIAMKDGKKYVVLVRDDIQETTDLSKIVTKAAVIGATIVDGKYLVKKGQNYGMSVSFKENLNYQLDNDAVLTYSMPSGLTVSSQQTGDLTFAVTVGNESYDVAASYSLGTDGLLQVTIHQDDPNYSKLTSATNASFTFNFNAEFNESSTVIDFGNNIKKELIFDQSPDAQVTTEKTATYDEANKRFTYTIKVHSQGGADARNIRVKDIVSGDALTNVSRPVVSGNSSNYSINFESNGFDYTFDSMADNETITITYTADVDLSKDTDNNGKIEWDQTKNIVTVQPENGPERGADYKHEIVYSSIGKSGSIVAQHDTEREMEWTVDVNPQALVSLKDSTFTDAISATGTPVVYTGDGITIKVYDREGGLVATRPVRWSELGVTPNSTASQGYQFTFNDDTPYHYVITYRTKVDLEDVTADVNVKNESTYKYGKAESYVGIPNDDKPDVTKSALSYNTQEVTWKSVLHVPESGLRTAHVIDTLPHRQLESLDWQEVVDFVKPGENVNSRIRVEGELPGETHTTVIAEDGKTFTIDFSSNEPDYALKRHPGGHDITVIYTTVVDQRWIQEAATHSEDYWQVHTNTIKFNNIERTADVHLGSADVNKLGYNENNEYQYGGKREPHTVIVDGKERTAYQFDIVLKNVYEDSFTDHLEVIDTFDTNVLELLDPSITEVYENSNYLNMYIYGGNDSNQFLDRKPVSYRDTSTGVVFIVNELPRENNGTLCSYFRITYYLLLKEGIDLNALAAENGGTYSVSNTANWSGHEHTAEYEVEYDYLKKEMLEEAVPKNHYATFKITFNEEQATLNDNNTIEITDLLHEMLSLDYSSVKITTEPAGREATYRVDGQDDDTLMTFKVPDSTKVVITYRALVISDDEATDVVIKNDVHALDRDVNFNEQKDITSASQGEADVYTMIVAKIDANDATIKLADVHFQLTCEREDLLPNQPVDLYTDDNGVLTIIGTDTEHFPLGLFPGVQYTLTEVEPKPDYLILDHPYYFTFVDSMKDVNYDNGVWKYFKTDSMQIKNWPMQGLIVQKQVESNQSSDKTKDYEFEVSILNEDGTVNESYNDKNGDDQFVNGKVRFTLSDGEQKAFWGFTKGTKYKVVELTDGYATSVEYKIFNEDGDVTEIKTDAGKEHVAELTQDKEIIVFKNAAKGSLKLTKSVTVNGRPPEVSNAYLTNGTYEYTITNTEDSSITRKVQITFENGKAKSYQIDSGEVKTVSGTDNSWTVEVPDLAAGSYTIEETTPSNGTTISSATGGTSVTDNVITVEVKSGKSGTDVIPVSIGNFVNNIDTGELDVSKDVVSNLNADAEQLFDFKVQLKKGSVAYANKDVTVNIYTGTTAGTPQKKTTNAEGYIDFTLKDDQTAKITDIPVDVTYEVAEMTETLSESFDTTSVNASGTISRSVSTSEFTNKRKPGELDIKKVVQSQFDPDKVKEFTFEVTLKEGDNAFANKSVTVQINTETGQGTTQGEAESRTTNENGVLTVYLKDNQTAKITGIPTTVTYSVVEIQENDFEPTVNGSDTGTISTNVSSVEFNNERKTGELSVTKAVKDTADDSTISGTYNYPVEISVVIDQTTYYVQDSTGKLGTNKPATPLTVSNTAELSISNLPYGRYTVTEVNPGTEVTISGYSYVTVDNSKSSGDTDVNTTAGKVDLVNYYTKGISWQPQAIKLLNDVNYDGSEFTFNLTGLKDASGYTDSVTIVASGQIIFKNIPYSVTHVGKDLVYKIEETRGSDSAVQYDNTTIYAKVTVSNVGGSLNADGKYYSDEACTKEITGNPTFKNTEVGKLTVEKTVDGAYEQSAEDTYPVTIKKGDKYLNANGELVDSDPGLTVKAGAANKLTFDNLPIGTYVVTEGDAERTGYVVTTTYKVGADGNEVTDKAEAIVQKGQEAAVTITNKYRNAELTLTKTLSGIEEEDLEKAAQLIIFKVEDLTDSTKVIPDWVVSVAELEGNQVKKTFTIADGVLPDHKYKVTETVTAPDGYILRSTSYVVSAGTPDDNNSTNTVTGALTLTDTDTSKGQIDFTNVYEKTKLTISKAMNAGTSTETFTFDVTIKNGTTSYTGDAYIPKTDGSGYEKISFDDGVYKASIKAGESLTIYGLPVGYTYEIKEDTKTGFLLVSVDGDINKTASTGAIGTEESTAAFVNREVTELSGTKTWVDTVATHTSPVLTLTRKSSKAGATAEVVKNSAGTENLQPTWEGNNYKYTDLPKYDDEGYEYTYEVAEASFEVNGVTYTAVKAADGTYTVTSDNASASGYTTVQNGNDFINTELTKFEFTKFWTTGGSSTHDAWHEGKTITVTLSRKLIPEGSTEPVADPDSTFSETYVLNKDGVVGDSTYPVTVTASGNDYTFTITGLPANGSMSIGGAETTGIWKYYLSEQAIDGYDVYYYESGASNENHGKESIDNGGSIQNDLKTFDLPHTGGIGTMPIRMAGVVMIVAALLGAFLMRRRERRCDG